jgi:flagellar motility protein MotE (MotC chaperone)
MNKSGLVKIRLFPSLLVVALAALTIRVSDVITGVGLLSEAALAQDTAQEDSQETAENTTEDAQPESAPQAARPPIVVGLPSSEEDQIITQLRERREQLEERSRQLDLQEQLLQSTEKKIEDKIVQLQQLEAAIKDHLRLFDEREDGQLKSIVEVYEKMKPKEAAPRFEALPLQTQLDLVTRMKSAKVAALMEKMSPEKASTLTKELATRAAPPSIQEVQSRGG